MPSVGSHKIYYAKCTVPLHRAASITKMQKVKSSPFLAIWSDRPQKKLLLNLMIYYVVQIFLILFDRYMKIMARMFIKNKM
jgi:hypothetical protein